MKKLLLGLGSVAAVAAPVAAVVACDAGTFDLTTDETTTLTKTDLKTKVALANTGTPAIETLEAAFGMSGTTLPTTAPTDSTVTVQSVTFDESKDVLTVSANSATTVDGTTTTSTTNYVFHITAYKA